MLNVINGLKEEEEQLMSKLGIIEPKHAEIVKCNDFKASQK